MRDLALVPRFRAVFALFALLTILGSLFSSEKQASLFWTCQQSSRLLLWYLSYRWHSCRRWSWKLLSFGNWRLIRGWLASGNVASSQCGEARGKKISKEKRIYRDKSCVCFFVDLHDHFAFAFSFQWFWASIQLDACAEESLYFYVNVSFISLLK